VRSKLVVILGAGASFDASSARHRGETVYPPPLVTQLFSQGGPDDSILRAYPLAEMAGSEIRYAANNQRGLEQVLREQYKESAAEHDRRAFFQVPLYLQHRLLVASSAFVPDSYDRLIMAALRLPEVVFVTLNYDLLLDQRLAALSPLHSLRSYITDERNWSLIKLHGSVNWAKKLETGLETLGGDLDPPFFARTFDRHALSAETAPGISMRPVDPAQSGSLNSARVEGSSLYYPLLSVPLGPDDELSCPDSHLEFFKGRLDAEDGFHALFLGYSGYDVAVMALLRESVARLRSVTVVNPDQAAGNRILEALGDVSLPTEVLCEGFTAFVNNGHLERVLERLH
jgi:hypothetical protein